MKEKKMNKKAEKEAFLTALGLKLDKQMLKVAEVLNLIYDMAIKRGYTSTYPHRNIDAIKQLLTDLVASERATLATYDMKSAKPCTATVTVEALSTAPNIQLLLRPHIYEPPITTDMCFSPRWRSMPHVDCCMRKPFPVTPRNAPGIPDKTRRHLGNVLTTYANAFKKWR